MHNLATPVLVGTVLCKSRMSTPTVMAPCTVSLSKWARKKILLNHIDLIDFN